MINMALKWHHKNISNKIIVFIEFWQSPNVLFGLQGKWKSLMVWWRCSNGSYFPFVWLSKLFETCVILDRDDNNSHLKKINICVNNEAIGEFELNL